MTTDVLYVSYRNDREWLRWSTATLEKHLTGHRRVIIVTPEQDVPLFEEIARERKNTSVVGVPDWPGMGYIWQQFQKLRADTFTDADCILHVDSDVFFKAPTKIEDFMRDGKPAWLWEFYRDGSDDIVWKGPTEFAFRAPVAREFMQAQPLLIRRRLYEECRDHIELEHRTKFEDFMLARGAEWKASRSLSFSEYNFMGVVAWSSMRDDYSWVHRAEMNWPAAYHKCHQFWSHSPLEDNMATIQGYLYDKADPSIRVTNRGIWVLSHDTHISKWVEQENRLDHDQHTLRRICEHIGPGDTVVDIGAFIGDHTIAYARATHGIDSGRVLAFEPNPTAFECLRRNMNGLAHVECHNMGLGDKPGEMAVAQNENAGASHLTKGKGVKIRTLDSFKLERCDLIKIDAEGMEVRILRGASKTLEAHHPTLYVEVNRGALERAGTSETELLAEIERYGYEIHGRLDGPQYDILCVHPMRKPKLKPIICAVGVCHRDIHLAALWLRWVSFLASQPGGDVSEFKLLITLTKRAATSDTFDAISSAVYSCGVGTSGKFFGVTMKILPDEWERGYPGSASHLFLRTLEIAGDEFPSHAVLWCETDTVAMKPSWFREIAQEYTRCGKPFMGARVNPHDQHAHMTGNGVYPPNWRELAPLIAEAHSAPGTEFWGRDKGQPWDVFAETQIEPQMHEARTIQQIWRPTTFSVEKLGEIRDDTCLFHQCKDGTLTLALTEARYPGFRKLLPPIEHAFALETGAKSIDVQGRKIDFIPVARMPGGKVMCAYKPHDIADQWLIDTKAGKEGVERISLGDYDKLMANRHLYRLD